MRSVPATVASVLSLCGAIGLQGCAVPHTMQPHPYGYHCPESDQSAATQAISWVGPAQEPDTTRLALWCQTVGPTVVDSIPGATLSPDAGYDPLMVVTWNLKGGSGDLERFLHDELMLTCNGSRSTTGDGFRHFVLIVQEAYRRSTSIPPFPRRRNRAAGHRRRTVERAAGHRYGGSTMWLGAVLLAIDA